MTDTAIFRCPDCGSEVEAPARLAAGDPSIGCRNVDEHEDGEPLVMWPQDDDLETDGGQDVAPATRCTVCGAPATGTRTDDGEPVCDAHTPRFEDVDARELIDVLVNAGPDGARTILPQAQAEALVYRRVKGATRNDTADALDVSVYTVDDRLARAEQNVEAVEATVRELIGLELVDPNDDLGLDVALGPDPHDADESGEDATQTTLDVLDADTEGLGALLDVDAVTRVTRAPDDTRVTVKTEDATDDQLDALEQALATAGYRVLEPEVYGSSGVVTLTGVHDADSDDEPEPATETPESDPAPANAPADAESEPTETAAANADVYTDAAAAAANGEPDAYTCHYCGDAFQLDEDSPELLVDWNEDAEHPACNSCLAGVAMGNGSADVLPEFRDRDDDTDDDVGDETDGSEDESDDEGVEPTEGLPEPFASLTPQYSGNEHEKRRAIYAAYEYCRDAGGATANDLREDVYPEHPADYGNAESWWRGVVRDGLQSVGAYSGGYRGHEWLVEDVDVEEADD